MALWVAGCWCFVPIERETDDKELFLLGRDQKGFSTLTLFLDFTSVGIGDKILSSKQLGSDRRGSKRGQQQSITVENR